MKLKNLLLRILSYSPKLYWETISTSFQNEAWQKKTHNQHLWLLSQTQKIKPKSILEVGCGFGRNLNFLSKNQIKPDILTGVDFSKKMIELAGQKLSSDTNLQVADATKLPFEKNCFDLVFTHGLLMHLPPAKVNFALGEIIRTSKKNIIIIEEIRQIPGKINNHTWAHDYLKLINQFPVKIIASSNKFQDLICLNLTKLPNTSTKDASNQINL